MDQSNGHVYVADSTNKRINEFDASGAFVQAFGVDVIPGGSATAESCTTATTCQAGLTSGAGAIAGTVKGIAVDPETHVVYVLAALARVAYFNGTTGAFIGQTEGNNTTDGNIDAGAPEQFSNGSGVAVDSSEAQHHLYVAIRLPSGLGRIDKFQISAAGVAAGSYVCQITGTAVASSVNSTECGGNGVPAHKNGIFEGIDLGSNSSNQQAGGNLTVDASGNVFIAEKIGPEVGGLPDRHYVSGFAKNGNFLAQFKPCCGSPALSVNEPRPSALATLPGGNVLVAVGGATSPAGGTRIQEYNPSSPAAPVTEFGEGTIGGSLGVAVSGTDVYVADKTNKKVWKYSAAPQLTLSVTKSGTGTGTVTSAPAGIDCGATCSAPFDEGTVVTLTPTANGISDFKEWSGACTGSGTCEVTMSAAKSVDAKFDLKPGHVLKVLKSGTGTGTVTSSPPGINCGATCEAIFTENTLVTLTAAADGNSVFTGWSGAGCSGTGTCEVTMSAAKEVTATFNLEQHLLSVTKDGSGTGTVTSAPAGIDCGATCSFEFDHDTDVVLSAAPGANTQATVAWAGCDSSTATTCTVDMVAAKAVTATFNLVKRQLSVAKDGTGAGTVHSSPAGVDCGATCSFEFDHDTDVVLTATPGANTQATVAWAGCDSSTATTCTVDMSAAKAVTATFSLQQRTLTVTKDGTATGTVTSAPAGINCGVDCTEAYDHGASVTLTGAPGANAKAVAWSGCDSVNGSNQCVVAMSAAKAVSATFDLQQRTLTVIKNGTGTGTVTCDGGPCLPTYSHGAKVTLAASPAADSDLAGWSGACSGSGACTVTMDADKAATATFNLKPPVVTDPLPLPPVPPSCVVPKLKGKPLGKAKAALKAADCALGKVTKPKAKKGKKRGPLAVKSSSPPAGTVLAQGAKVNLKLAKKPKGKKKGKKKSKRAGASSLGRMSW